MYVLDRVWCPGGPCFAFGSPAYSYPILRSAFPFLANSLSPYFTLFKKLCVCVCGGAGMDISAGTVEASRGRQIP